MDYPKKMPMPVAWEEFVGAVEDIKKEVEPQLGIKPVIVGMDHYFLASEIGFYLAKSGEGAGFEDDHSVITARHLFGFTGLMYDIWNTAEDFIGKDCIIIGFNPTAISDSSLRHYFESLSEIKTIEIKKNNVFVHTFAWRIWTSYHLRRNR